MTTLWGTTIPRGGGGGGGGGGVADWNEQQIYYVGKHGNDAWNGRAIHKAKLTFANAIATAVAAIPSAVNRFAIVCVDAGVYTENIALNAYVDVFAPDAVLNGTVTLVDNSSATLNEIQVAAAVAAAQKLAGAGLARLQVKQIVAAAGTGVAVSAGTVDVVIHTLTAATVWNVAVGTVLNGFATEVTGAQVNNGDTRVVIGRAAPIENAGNPNGAVNGFFGQLLRDTTGGVSYTCTSYPTGTVWSVI